MMKKLIIIVICAIVFCLATSCSNQQKDTDVYSVRAQGGTIEINNGMIIITNEMEKFIGGDITFNCEEISGIKEYNTRFYYYKDGEKIDVLSMSTSLSGSDDGMIIQTDLGSSSSTSLFINNALELIQESLNFELTGTFLSGDTFEYKTPVEVAKVY